MNGCKLKYTLTCILVVLLCTGYVVKAQSPPSNNNCQNAMSIGEVVNRVFNTTNATFDGPGHCMRSPNIWYRYTAACTGNVTVSLCGSSYDTVLAVYSGGVCNPQQSALIGCNDDACGQQSELSFNVVNGIQYLIEVGGYGTATGQGVISISTDGTPPGGLTNNDCSNAIHIGNVTNLAFDTSNATFDGSGYCMTSKNIWYCYTAPRTSDVTVSLCGSSYDTKLAVYNGCGCSPMPGHLIRCNDDFCGRQSEVTFAAIAGNRYLIEIGGWTDSDFGQGVLNITSEGGAPPSEPANDNCNQAEPVGNVTDKPFSTVNATFDGRGLCMRSPNIWYRYTAACTGDVTVSLCGSGYDTKLAVYNAGNCPPRSSDLIECNDDACGWQSELTFEATAGNQYLIEVGGFGADTGDGVMSISCDGAQLVESDLGDAPDSSNNYGRYMTAYPKGGPSGVRAYYPTVYDDGRSTGPYGPIHLNSVAVAHLGRTITRETEADSGPDQDGVNNITPQSNSPGKDKGDDGVIFPVSMPHCRWTTFDYYINVIDPDTHLLVNVWCDWNRDGDWDDDSDTNPTIASVNGFVSEWAVQNQFLFDLPVGLNRLTTPAFLSWHPSEGRQQIWMRISLSEQPWLGGSAPGSRGNGGSGPQEGYEFGETEDYYFTPDKTCSICEDYNGDGVINHQDLTALTNDWLENCQ
ncbi:MAG: GEVED domain-containing protein [Phycisphaerales bacterium]